MNEVTKSTKGVKIIYIPCNLYEGDFTALIFEQNFEPTLEVWNILHTRGYLESKNGEEISGEALEFKEVDPEFIKFIKDNMDYDTSKETNFYVVEDKKRQGEN